MASVQIRFGLDFHLLPRILLRWVGCGWQACVWDYYSYHTLNPSLALYYGIVYPLAIANHKEWRSNPFASRDTAKRNRQYTFNIYNSFLGIKLLNLLAQKIFEIKF